MTELRVSLRCAILASDNESTERQQVFFNSINSTAPKGNHALVAVGSLSPGGAVFLLGDDQ